LLTAVVLLLAAMKGFLLDSLEFGGRQETVAVHGEGAHVHGLEEQSIAHEVARGVVRAVLSVLPDLSELDRTDRVAMGDWTDPRQRSGRALLYLCGALLLAGVLGGIGVHQRRLP
jgi:hypothetical protein